MKVQFFWLSCIIYAKEMQVDVPPVLLSGLDCGPKNTRLYDCNIDTRIKSGDVLVFYTKDPVKLPLTSMDLLNMRGLLNRLLAMSGAADAPELEEGEGGDEDTDEEEVEEEKVQSPIPEIPQIGENRPLQQRPTQVQGKRKDAGEVRRLAYRGGDSHTQ
jgi:hypothetical protein